MRWRVLAEGKEGLRGLIRGATVRERGLVPGPIRSRQRRLRHRLVAVYLRRFGRDDFVASLNLAKLGRPPRRNWLPRGYAHWRARG